MSNVNATATLSSSVEDRNTVFQALKGGALALLVLWTIAANSLVFIVLYKNPRLQTVPNLLVGNLAFSDLCLGFIVLPLSSVYAIAEQWVFPGLLCEIFVSADILCCTASIWGLSIVGLDRYWAITSPVAYMAKRTKRTAVIMIIGVWILASLISLAPLLGWKQAAPRSNYFVLNDTAQCTFLDLPSYTVYSATGSFFTPTIVMFFVYLKIYQAFAKHRARQIYRQKVIRKHIESTILHEISHVLPTSDEFAKEEEEEDDDEDEEESESSERKNGPIIEVDEEVCLGDGAEAGGLGGSSHESTSGRAETSTSNNNDEPSTVQGEMSSRRKHKFKQLDRVNNHFSKTVGFRSSTRSESSVASGSKQNSLRMTKRSINKSNLTYEKVQRHKNRKERRPMYRKSLQRKPKAISAAKERRGVKVLGIILGCFTICWTPFFVMYVVVQFCAGCAINPHIEMFITWLGYSNSAMNPIIYTVFNRDYQIALKRLFTGDTRPVGTRRAL